MRSHRRSVLAGVALGLCGSAFGVCETYRARRLEAQVTGGRRPLALSKRIGDRPALRRELAARKAERRVLAARALAARAGPRAFERAVDASLTATGVEVAQRTPWTRVEELQGKVGPHAAAFSTKLTVRASFPALLRVARSWEVWPDGGRLRSLEVRPFGSGRVEAVLELVVVRVLPSAPYVLPDGVRVPSIVRPLRSRDEVQDPFARAFARARLQELRVTVQGVAAGSDPRALVSGRVVRVGDQLDVFTIESIDREGVVIRGPGGLRARLRRRVPAPRSAPRR